VNLDKTEQNLALIPGVSISVSVNRPSGGGSRDPNVLLNDRIQRLDGQPHAAFDQRLTFDTYDGQNEATGPDWYQLNFPEPVTVNCIEIIMGFPYIDGGWWISLTVEVWDELRSAWQSVVNLRITPDYDFRESGAGRKLFDSYALTFEDVCTSSLRLIGQPGGLAQFVSLARIGVYHRDLSVWTPIFLPDRPVPRIFKLINPNTIWDLSQSFVKLTGLGITISHLQYYLDEERYWDYWRTIGPQYVERAPYLWRLLGDTMGWHEWNQIYQATRRQISMVKSGAYVALAFEDTFALVVAPVIVEGQTLGELASDSAIFTSNPVNWTWHRAYAEQLDIPWVDYYKALERMPHMSLDQLEGMAELLGMVANLVANLTHSNIRIQQDANGTVRSQRKAIARQAIEFMSEHLEDAIKVADVAQAVNVNAAYFCKLFTEEVGCHPRDYLIELRIARAKEYLTHTTMSITDVCAALGYHPVYFCRLFKRMTGLLPSEYIQKARQH
jgi:AraC-like DNA-binding protein